MSGHMGIKQYRARLGDQSDPQFAIVVVQDNGSISWSVVSEQEFNGANCDDLPEDLFEQVNDFFGQLNFTIEDETETTAPQDD